MKALSRLSRLFLKTPRSSPHASRLCRLWLLDGHSELMPSLSQLEFASSSRDFTVSFTFPNTEEDSWRNTTERLLETPQLSSSSSDIHKAEKALQWWIRQRTAEGVEKALEIAERMEQEQCLKLQSLNYAVDGWKIIYVTEAAETLPSPLEMAEWISDLTSVQPNIKTHTLILKAAVKTDPLFCLEYVEQMIQMDHLHFNRPAFNTVLQAISNLQPSQENLDQTQLWLQRMHTLGAHDPEVAPDILTYNFVLSTWAKSGNKQAGPQAQHFFKQIVDADLEPNEYTYAAFLHCWATSAKSYPKEAGFHANKILRDLKKPTRVIYNTALRIHAERGSTSEALAVLNTMIDSQDKDLRPDIISFKSLISAYAKQGDSARARGLAERMTNLYRSGYHSVRPDVSIFNRVLESYASSTEPGSAKCATTLLQSLEDDYGLQPNSKSYGICINAWSKSGEPQAAEEAEALLFDMVQKCQASGSRTDLKPSLVSFRTAMYAWAKSVNPNAAERAELLLERMRDLHQSGYDVEPEVTCYNAALECWSKCESEGSAIRAERLLRQMETANDEKNPGTRPNSTSFALVIQAFAKSKQEGSASRAEDMLYEQIARAKEDPAMLPTLQSFSVVLHAWAQSGDPEAGDKADTLLRSIADLREDGLGIPEPNTQTLSAAFSCWVRSRDRRAAGRAFSYLDRMEKHCVFDSRTDAAADRTSFTALLSALSCSGERGAARRASEILHRMFRLSEGMNDLDLLPDRHSFSAVLKAWASSGDARAGEEAETIIMAMRDLHKEQGVDVKPNIIHYSIALDCWANSKLPWAAERAESILRLMQTLCKQGEMDVRPNTISYTTVIKAFSRRGLASRAQSLLREMWDEFHIAGNKECLPNTYTYNWVIQALARYPDAESIDYAEELLDEMVKLSEKYDEISPNATSYGGLLMAIARSCVPCKANLAQRVLRRMEKSQVHPDRFVMDWCQRCRDTN